MFSKHTLLLPSLALLFGACDFDGAEASTGARAERQQALGSATAQVTSTSSVTGSLDGDGRSLFTGGSLDAATAVEVFVVGEGGALSSVGSGVVTGETFVVAVSQRTDTMLVVATDEAGEWIAAGLAGSTSASSRLVQAGELTVESSVEAMVYLEAEARHGGDRAVGWVDVVGRVDAAVAVAVAASGEVDTAIEVLADASVAAQATEQEMMESVGVWVDESRRLSAEVAVYARAAADANLSLEAALDAQLSSFGVSPADRVALGGSASAAFRASLAAASDEGSEWAAQAQRASVRSEVAATARAQAALSTASTLDADLWAELRVATRALFGETDGSTEAAASAVVDFRAEAAAAVEAMFEEAHGDDSAGITLDLSAALGLGAGASLSSLVDASLGLVAEVSADLHVEIASVAEQGSGTSEAEVEAIATASAQAWLEAREELEGVVEAMADAQLSVETTATLLLLADAQFAWVD